VPIDLPVDTTRHHVGNKQTADEWLSTQDHHEKLCQPSTRAAAVAGSSTTPLLSAHTRDRSSLSFASNPELFQFRLDAPPDHSQYPQIDVFHCPAGWVCRNGWNIHESEPVIRFSGHYPQFALFSQNPSYPEKVPIWVPTCGHARPGCHTPSHPSHSQSVRRNGVNQGSAC